MTVRRARKLMWVLGGLTAVSLVLGLLFPAAMFTVVAATLARFIVGRGGAR